MTTLDIDLTDVAHGGSAVGRAEDGRVVFARFGLPGERVRVRVAGQRSTLIRGDVVEVVSDPSPHRVDLVWPEAGPLGVGGADLGHVAFDYQAEWKSHVLATTIGRIGGRELADHLQEQGFLPEVRALPGDAETSGWGTRTRIEFVVGEDGRPAMYRDASRELLGVTSFPLAVEEIDELDLFGPWRSWWRPGERVKALAPSGSDPVVFIGGDSWWAPGMRAQEAIREDVVVDGELYAYRVHAGGFWQVHRKAAASLVELVLRGAKVQPGEAVVELYSGAGLLTQPLAIATGEKGTVYAMEAAHEAVGDARSNLEDLPWARCRTARIDARAVEGINGDVVVADPPRAGLGTELAAILGEAKIGRIVLVSCDPASMARDVAVMRGCGRKVTSFEAIDIFPNTHHFECVTVVE